MKQRIALVTDRIGVVDTFSLPIMAATAKRGGHDVILVEYDRSPRDAVSRIQSFEADILAYSVMSPDAQTFLEINRHLKKETGAFSIVGGVHPTFFQKYLDKDGIDAICVGEGDVAFPDFLDAFGTDDMYGVTNMHFNLGNGEIVKNGLSKLVPELDSLPFPDKEIVYEQSYFLRNLPIRSFAASRGCPYKCTYCFNHAFNALYEGKGKVMRFKSIPYFIDEIKRITDKYPTKFIKFQDDIFGAKRSWLAEFAEVYPREIGLPFLNYCRPNMVNDEYCKNLKKAGCHSVAIAIEAGNEDIRNKVMLRNMKTEDILTAFETLRRYDIKTYCLNILGLPGETIDTFMETVHINQDCKVDYGDASVFQPYPGTDITKYSIEHGFLEEEQEHWGGQFSPSVLNFPESERASGTRSRLQATQTDHSDKVKSRLHAIHKVFPLLVEKPWLERWLGLIEAINNTALGSKLLDMIFRFSYGYMLHRRIYPVPTPFRVTAWAAWTLVFSKHRN